MALDEGTDVAIPFEHLHSIVARRKTLRQLLAVRLHRLVESHNALLDNTLVDVDMAYSLIALLVYGDYGVEQLLYATTTMPLDRHHRHAQHLTQHIVVEGGVVEA